ncbi:MAG: HAMP domain-containing protein [Deltaproteobacteria bacterium]|nr:HAMP domain-containing protein [Deltaproteobacteria bacterium]NCP02258.1 HAMP domain-containing protein [Deltaproteobacteria bacterium]NCP78514.1 HAMP domain-containing protein [Desulfuromonadales bacterium]
MRLTIRITAAVMLGIVLIFSLYSYLSIQREREQLKKNLSREARNLGEALLFIVEDLLVVRGEDAAMAFLARRNQLNPALQARWVWLDAPTGSRFHPLVEISELDALARRKPLSLMVSSQNGHDFLLTYLPTLSKDGRLGAIEVRESMDELHGYVQESMRRSAMVVGAAVVSGLMLMAVLGSLWINRPVRHLREQAERIGTGDFSARVQVGGRDELGKLAHTIEQMRSQLALAREAEEQATREKIETLETLRHTERLATLGRLSAGMAHELGTPLNVISGRAKLIASNELSPAEAAHSAQIIGEQAERMTRIMRQLLDYARRGESRKQRVNPCELLKKVVELLASVAQKQRVEITLECPEDPTPYVRADPAQLQQVLLNLALNGIQAMEQGGELSLGLRIAEPWVQLQVRDQGRGISAEDLPHIFDPFFTTKEVGRGTGLGLSIAHGIISEHKGQIEVQSTPGQGSCFLVNLPAFEVGAADEV